MKKQFDFIWPLERVILYDGNFDKNTHKKDSLRFNLNIELETFEVGTWIANTYLRSNFGK